MSVEEGPNPLIDSSTYKSADPAHARTSRIDTSTQTELCMGVIEANPSISGSDCPDGVLESKSQSEEEGFQVETSEGRCALEIEDRRLELPGLVLPPPIIDTSTSRSDSFTSPDPVLPPSPPSTPINPHSAILNVEMSAAALCHMRYFPPLDW